MSRFKGIRSGDQQEQSPVYVNRDNVANGNENKYNNPNKSSCANYVLKIRIYFLSYINSFSALDT